MARTAKHLTWSPKARHDLQQIWRYFARVASHDVADRLVREIGVAGLRLRERPFIGRPREEVMPGLRSLRVHPYALFYRVIEDRIEIARILHERRNLASEFPVKRP
jgi:toxin ParE1/3/4